MTRQEAERLVSVIREMAGRDVVTVRPAVNVATESTKGEGVSLTVQQQEDLYQSFRRRFIAEAKTDPVLLHLMATRPEIVLEFEPRVVTLDGATLKGRSARLLAAGWFTGARATSAVRKELARTGTDPGGGGTLSDNLAALCRDGFLVREGDGWTAAPDVKITERAVEARA